MKEGTMTAIVLDHEEPHEKARRRHREQKAEPVAEIERYLHQGPEQDKRPDRDDELDDAARKARRAITGKDLRPAVGVGRNRARFGYWRTLERRRGQERERNGHPAGFQSKSRT
jgi:hypothetical protein